MFDVGPAEILVILVVAIVVFGPDKLPQFARQAGRLVRTTRRMMNDARADLAAEMGDDFEGLKDLKNLNPREFVRRNVLDGLDDDDDEAEPEKPRSRRGHRPLGIGESPPFDPDST